MTDLAHALDVASTHAIPATDRLDAAPALRRIRRRRTVHASLQGLTGAAAVGALLLATPLIDLPGPATPEPAPTMTGAGALAACGTTLDAIAERTEPGDGVVDLVPDEGAVEPGATITALLSVFDPDGLVHEITVVAARDGVVAALAPSIEVGSGAVRLEGPAMADSWTSATLRFALVPCGSAGATDPGPLDPGTYDLVAIATPGGATGSLATAPTTLVVAPLDPQTQAAADADPPPLDALVLRPDGFGPYAAGARVPAVAHRSDVIRWDPDACAGTGRWRAAYPPTPGPGGEPYEPFLVEVRDGTILTFTVGAPGPRTPEGLQVGASLDDLLATYPAAVRIHSAAQNGSEVDTWFVQHPGGGLYVIEVASNDAAPTWGADDVGRVITMKLSMLPSSYDGRSPSLVTSAASWCG